MTEQVFIKCPHCKTSILLTLDTQTTVACYEKEFFDEEEEEGEEKPGVA